MLPIPALDGGRVLFIIVELVRGGRKVSQKIENVAHIAGFLVLMSLILVMSFVDISRIISGESLF
jgi:regulator of sigma E protease